MFRRGTAIFCLCSVPQVVLGGCLSLLDPPFDSACTKSSGELTWFNSARLLERVKLPRLPYDHELYDSALTQGLAVRGDLQFELRAQGEHLVEIFLAVDLDDEHSFVLEAKGEVIDSRFRAYPQAPRAPPRPGLRAITLLGILAGPFTVRSDSPRYLVSAVRWTPVKEFEENLAPVWLDRARQMVADPFFEELRAARRASLEQLYGRLALSARPEVRREAVVGQARAAYWLAAEDHEPRDIARLDTVFREAFKLAPEDRALRQMISASCRETNVRSSRMPYSAYCVDAAPVPWTVDVPPVPPEAPDWAVHQRRFAARLEAIARWWVERRQRPNGELGGGWEGDAEMLRNWGPQALGLGSPSAALGLRRLEEGLLQNGATVPAPWTAYLDGEGRYDAALRENDEPLPLIVLWSMASTARDSEAILTRDFDMYTSEVIYTDRVYYPLTPDYQRHLLGGDAPGFAVTWVPSETDFARAVISAGPALVRLRLYSFEPRPMSAQVRLWCLEPGRYRWRSAGPSGAEISGGDLAVSRKGQRLSLPLPPATEIDVTIRQVQP